MIEELEELQGTYIDETRVYVLIEGGRLWAMARATDKATFDAKALEVGLKVYSNPAIPAVIDPETGEEVTPAVPASGPIVSAPLVDIHEIGPYTLVPGTYDDEGNELTPPVVDSRWHVNFWLNPKLVERGLWKQWALMWTQNGQAGTPNHQEESVIYEGVELIDPLTVSSPANRML